MRASQHAYTSVCFYYCQDRWIWRGPRRHWLGFHAGHSSHRLLQILYRSLVSASSLHIFRIQSWPFTHPILFCSTSPLPSSPKADHRLHLSPPPFLPAFSSLTKSYVSTLYAVSSLHSSRVPRSIANANLPPANMSIAICDVDLFRSSTRRRRRTDDSTSSGRNCRSSRLTRSDSNTRSCKNEGEGIGPWWG